VREQLKPCTGGLDGKKSTDVKYYIYLNARPESDLNEDLKICYYTYV